MRQLRRGALCCRAPGHFPPKSPVISGSFTKNDLQLKASCGSPPPCTTTTALAVDAETAIAATSPATGVKGVRISCGFHCTMIQCMMKYILTSYGGVTKCIHKTTKCPVFMMPRSFAFITDRHGTRIRKYHDY